MPGVPTETSAPTEEQAAAQATSEDGPTVDVNLVINPNAENPEDAVGWVEDEPDWQDPSEGGVLSQVVITACPSNDPLVNRQYICITADGCRPLLVFANRK